jgi:hypothetical protein
MAVLIGPKIRRNGRGMPHVSPARMIDPSAIGREFLFEILIADLVVAGCCSGSGCAAVRAVLRNGGPARLTEARQVDRPGSA